jgi:hypothetical protein
MIGPVHPELGREMQNTRQEEIARALKGCRRAVPRRHKEDR